jgi:hypothetical protein
MQMNEDFITLTGTVKTEKTQNEDLYIIEDKNDPDYKLLKKKIKINRIIKNMKGILIVLTMLIVGMASTASAAMKHYGGNAPIDTIEKNQRGGE